jgi:acyl transferase domain-containing protein/acetylornithine/succinyldiaminopimelate/putrescine aminotransferase
MPTTRDAIPGNSPPPEHAIAVVGMVGRFPGAADVDTLWSNLCAGREGVRFFRDDELDSSIPEALRRDPLYVKSRGVIADYDRFDAELFGVSPLEAQIMDPQHRVLLELARAALEHSGHRASDFPGRIGVFVGANWNRYRRHCVASRPDLAAGFGELNEALANEQDFLATRISYKLGLRGPSLTVSTACSTSLVAIVQAVRCLLAGDCDLVLAGGVSITVPVASGHRYDEGSMLSADGHCRPFDKASTGTTFGDGAGLVVLRRLTEALAYGDHVHAVIRGVAVNNDGHDKVGFGAPSIAGQAAVLSAALGHARVDPSTIGYVEAHGTGTPMGDPIELTALARAYRASGVSPSPCAIGSVKSCVGHLVHAAGVTGFITAVKAVQTGVIPPVLFFEEANPRLALDANRFYVAKEARRWPTSATPRRAGVSSFGVGGTNAHVVIEEAPAVPERREASGPFLLGLSARNAAALERQLVQLRDFLAAAPKGASLADVAFTLAHGRERLPTRLAIVVDSFDAASAALGDTRRQQRGVAAASRDVVFALPGNGVQSAGMGAGLYAADSTFRRHVDHAASFVRDLGGPDVHAVLVGAGRLDDHRTSHLALFVYECALAAALEARGLVPDILVGCSLGELAAAVCAGVLSFEDGLRAVLAIADASAGVTEGRLLTVFCSEEEALEACLEGVDVAAVHAEDVVVLGGASAAIDAARAHFRAREVQSALLPLDRAYHTPAMAPAVRDMAATLAELTFATPTRSIVSSALGRELTHAEAISPSHWAGILSAPVRLLDSLDYLGEGDRYFFVEVGPGVSLTTPALDHADARCAEATAAMPSPLIADDTEDALRLLVARAWTHGAEVVGATVGQGVGARRVPLPTYPYERVRHWIDAPAQTTAITAALATPIPAAAASVAPLDTRLAVVLQAASGLELDVQSDEPWADHGFDSLDMTQLANGLRREFEVEVGFRELMERCSSPRALLRRLTEASAAKVPPSQNGRANGHATPVALAAETTPEAAAVQRPNPGARIERSASAASALTPAQRSFIDQLLSDYAARTAASKAFAQAHRRELADPRTVSGFNPVWKEIVYPIVTERSRGSRLWDIDGNEYIDFLNGFGSVMFGHSPDFVTDAVKAQLDLGIEIGPQTRLAGEVARRFCELTGNERVAFTNTGSEAVAAALRLARTVTGRDKVVMFEGAYHGIFDEVVVRAGAGGVALPGAPGVPRSHVSEVLVLPYGEDAALQRIEALGPELAAVLVEPVQSRRPELAPAAFLRRLRELTAASGAALVFDEVVTGFRTHPGGIQALFDVRADMALYGKVIAGGYPLGLVAGKARFLDALDGGQWQFGDTSVPEVGVTFFAGTFVRHPAALAAVRAVLERLRAEGPALQQGLGRRTMAMVDEVRGLIRERGVGVRIECFSSFFFMSIAHSAPFGGLLYALLRQRGIHIWEHFPCFLTTSHSNEDLRHFVEAFRESLDELVAVGLLPQAAAPLPVPGDPDAPPVVGARRGKRVDGSLAWFVEDAARPGKYREFSLDQERRDVT